jgi:uncharacterized membrane protein YdbT with pleckstrin-like domain
VSAGDRRYLLPGERVEREVRRHGAVLLRPVLETLLATVLAGFLQRIVAETALNAIVLLALLFVYLRLAWKIAEWVIERIYLTDRRLFLVGGLLTRKVSALPLPKLTDLQFERSPAGRVLGYGRLRVESAGQHQALELVDYIPEPDAFYQDVCRLVFGPLASRSDGTT